MSAAAATADESHHRHLFGFEFPDFSVLKDGRVQTIIFARNISKLGIATLSYGAMVYLADNGASQIQVSVVGAMGYLAALLFGSQGGAVVDSMSKRNALMAGYAGQAALCIIFPIFFGADVIDLTVLAFLVASLATITSPALKATVPLVATVAAMATVAAVLNLFGSFGTAIGQAFVAPVLIKVSGIDAVMYASGVILACAAVWVRRVPIDPTGTGKSTREALKGVDWKPKALDLRGIARWIIGRRAVATIILVGAVVYALGEAVGTLIPVYVRDVLDADPSWSIYIFAPAGLGYLAGAVSAPWLIHKYGERRVGSIALTITAVGVMLYGVIDLVAPFLAPISPCRLFELLGVDLSDKMLAAGFIAMPANYGSTATSAAVQNYINRRLPLITQGGVFGMERVIENALSLVAVLGLGAIATVLGSQVVFLVAPVAVFAVVVWLLRYSYRVAGQAEPTREVLEELWGREAGEAPATDSTPGQ
ncbi:MAG TPA: MFS transporter [Thermomicrobiales bacterium]|jgi:MFS family permease